MKKPIVVLDVDDVLLDLLPLWLKILNNKYNTDVKPEDVTVWDMRRAFPTLTFEQIHEPLVTPEFWEAIQPVAGAIDGVNCLIKMGCLVYLCTATHYKNIPYKFAALEKWFPMIPRDRIIVAKDKSLIACDYMVDDAVHNLAGEHVRYKILVDAPYNQQGFDADNVTTFRVKNWAAITVVITICMVAERQGEARSSNKPANDKATWGWLTKMNPNEERICSYCSEVIRSDHWDYCPNCGMRMNQVDMGGRDG